MDKQLHQSMLDKLEDGQLPCNRAHAIAQNLDLEPLQIGFAANETDIRIAQCQLGLFGYGPKAEGRHKIVHAMDEVPERLAARLRAQAEGESITCKSVWEVADKLGYKRIEASSAVEAIGLRVSRCQLGCFPRPWEE